MEHKRRLQAKGTDGALMSEKEKAEYFIANIWGDVKDNARIFKDRAVGITSMIKDSASGIIGIGGGRHRSSSRASVSSNDSFEEGGERVQMGAVNPLHGQGAGANRGGGSGAGGRGGTKFAPVERSEPSEELQTRHLSTIAEGDEEEGGSSPRSTSIKAAASTSASPVSLSKQVYDFYSQHNPSKMDSVPEILAKYRGREGVLLAKLKKQYNV